MDVLAQPSDLRRMLLRSFGRESFAVIGPLALTGAPPIRRAPFFWRTRFLFVGSQVHYPLLSAPTSRSDRRTGLSPCGSCGSLRPASQRTSTSYPCPCWAHQQKSGPERAAPKEAGTVRSAREELGKGGPGPKDPLSSA